MQTLARFAGRKVGVLGLARSGRAMARALQAADCEPVLFDDRPEAMTPLVEQGMTVGSIDLVPELAAMAVSPGVPLTHPRPHPVIEAARRCGIEITCDIDLFAQPLRRQGHRLVAVTGTNGKSTTAALVHHLLRAAGCSTRLGGNIGLPVYELDIPSEPTFIVLEVSSFQLDLCSTLRPHVAVWLNLTPDHLDRHGDMKGYARAKQRLFAQMQGSDLAIVCTDDEPSNATARSLSGQCRVIRFASTAAKGDYTVSENALATGGETIVRLDGLRALRGLHNAENAAAAALVLKEAGVGVDLIRTGLETFAGLPHRAEEVACAGGVRFVNDSKATNPESAARSLDSYRNIHWLAGGRAKPGGFQQILSHLEYVRRAYLFGEAAAELESALRGQRELSLHPDMADALASATSAALRDPAGEATVLLAPACASFDQFASYEERGDRFRQLARSIAAGLDLGGAA